MPPPPHTHRYTGKLPDASPEELLKMIRLADQYQVNRFMAAASASFESLPLAAITQGVMLEVSEHWQAGFKKGYEIPLCLLW